MLDRAAGRVLVLGVLVLVMVGLASGQQVAGVAGTDADNPDRVESFENDLGGWSKEGSSSSLAISRVSSGFNTPSAFDGDKFVEVDVTADETTSSGVQGIEKTIDLTKFDAIEVYVTSMFDNGPVKLWVDGNLQKEIQPTSFKGLEVDLTQFDGNHDIGIGTNIPSGQNRRSGIDFVRLYEGNTAPSIDSSSISPDPPLIGDALDVSASASDPDGSVQSLEVEIFQDGTSVFSSSTSSSSLDINDAYTVQEGTVDVKFTATDDAGATTTDTITRTVSDTAPASPTINKPTGNFNTPTTQYDVTVPSDGDDFPGESLTLTLKKDGSQVDQVTTSEGSTVTGSFQTSTEGSHNFDVVVEEPDGETSTASSNYNVDFVDPTVDSLSVSPSPLEYETASDVTVGASDNVEVQEVCVSVDKDGSTFVSQTCRQTASSTVSETFTDFFTPDETNSDYTVTTTVTDNQGETGTSTQTFTLSNDAPTASGSFNPSTFGFDDQIDVSYSFSDPNGNFDQGTITAFKDGSQVASTTVNSLSGTLTDFFTITETNSDYTVNLTATDLQGASNTFSETQTVLNQAPTLSDSYNPSTWTFNDNVEINFDFNDANGNIDTRSITVFKDGSQIQSFSPTQNEGTIQDAFLVDETGSTYKVELSTTDLQGQTASGSTSQFVSNTAPIAELNATPSTFFLGDQIDLSYDITDNEGDVVTQEIRIFEAGSKIKTIQLQNNSDTLTDVFEIDQRNTEYQAQLFVQDSDGQTDSDSITQTITDDAPSVSVSSPVGEFFKYNHGVEFSVQDSDRVPEETYNCDVLVDGATKTGFTLVEGENTSVDTDLRSDLGSHTLKVSCSDPAGQTGSDQTSFSVEDFRIDSVSSASNVFETENVSYSLSFSQGAIVNQEGSSVKLFYGDDSESYSFDPKAAQTQSFRNLVPLVSSNNSVKDWRIQVTYNASRFSGGTELREANSSVKSQNVFFNYHSPSLNPSKTDMVERQEFSVTTDVVNEIGDEKADLSFPSSFEGETKTGKQSSFVFPLVQDTNKTSLPVSGSVEVSFEGETETRQASPVSVTGYRKVLTDCSTGLDTAKALDISVFDEKNRTSLKSQIGWEFSVSANGHSRSFQFNKTASATQNCIYPDFAQYQVSGDVFYESPEKTNSKDVSYPGRIYTVTGDFLNNDTSSLDLYLLSERFATPVSYKVIDSARSAVEDVELSVQKYFSETNSFVTVAQLKTGDDGTDTSFIETNDIYYRHVLSQGNKTLKSSDREPFFCSSVPCQKTFQIGATGIDSFFTEKEGFEFRCGKTFENGNVSGFECEVGHNGDLMENASLNMFRQDPIGETQICSAEGTSNQMTLICPLNETEGESFEFALEASTSGETYTLKTGVLDFTTNLTGTQALFPAFVVFLAFSMLGLITPKVSIIFSTAGFLVAYGFGFIAVSTAAVGSIVAVALFMVITSET